MNTKTCTRCQKAKSVNDFNHSKTRKEGTRAHCRECEREQARAYYKKKPQAYKDRAHMQRDQMRNYLGTVCDSIKITRGCHCCGENELCTLDLHHVEKGVPVTRALSKGYSAFEREINKCVVLCCNCHRKVHSRLITLSVSDKIGSFKVERLGKEGLERYQEKDRFRNNTSVEDLYG
jgi:hypothetical protein